MNELFRERGWTEFTTLAPVAGAGNEVIGEADCPSNRSLYVARQLTDAPADGAIRKGAPPWRHAPSGVLP